MGTGENKFLMKRLCQILLLCYLLVVAYSSEVSCEGFTTAEECPCYWDETTGTCQNVAGPAVLSGVTGSVRRLLSSKLPTCKYHDSKWRCGAAFGNTHCKHEGHCCSTGGWCSD